MKTLRRFFLFATIAVLFMAALPVATAQAAESAVARVQKTVVVTEEQINNSYWFTHSVHSAVSNKHATFNADGTVVISATITRKDGSVHNATSTWKPYIRRGVLIFNFVSASVDSATPTTADRNELRLAHQYIIRDAIRDYIRKQVGSAFVYQSVAVTQGQVSITVWVPTSGT